LIKRKITLGGSLPYSAARAKLLANTASGFSARILLQDSRGTFNGKSMLGLLSLGKLCGRDMVLLAEGVDEEQAVLKLSAMLEENWDTVALS
jgi:phosphotransferase system HPr (HPr) family protein